MARKKKKKTQRNPILLSFAVYGFLVCFLLYVCSCMFIKAYNNTLSSKMQAVQAQVTAMEQENNEAEKQVQLLASQSRVSSMAQNSLAYQANNIVTIDK